MQEKGLLSFCVVGYNHSEYAKSCIDAISSVQYPHKEIVILDDGSKDDSVVVINDLVKKLDFPVKTIFQENTGNVPANFNKVIEHASGEFIIMMSLDDVVCSENISSCIELLQSNSSIPFIASTSVVTINCNNKGTDEIVAPLKLDSIVNPSVDELLELEYSEFGAFYIQGAIWRRSVIECSGKFDEDILGDDIVLRTKVFRYLKSVNNEGFVLQKNPIIKYRRHENNLSKNYGRQVKIVCEYLDRYWPERESPKLLIDWIICAIGKNSFKDSLKFLASTPRSLKLLDNKLILKKIKNKFKKENSCFRYLFKKIKQGNEREIILFSCISIRYHVS